MNILGIIAGWGRLPVEVAKTARSTGRQVVAIGALDSVDDELKNVVDGYYPIDIGQLGKIITALQEAKVEEVILIGKVDKELLFQNKQMDPQMRTLLAGLPNYNDDTLMLAFVRELMLAGLKVLDQTQYIRPLLAQKGVLTVRRPDEREWQDIEYGFAMAKEIGRLDIGQTVVVKNRAVMAVEAIEGTDAAIRRGGQLARGGAVIAKTAKPQQDVRFDMPGIGPDTLQTMIEAQAGVLVVEAGKTLLINREMIIKMADDHGIAIVAIEG